MTHFRNLTRWEVVGCSAAGLVTAFVAYFAAGLPPLVAVLGGYLFFISIAIAIVDFRNFIIPDALSLPAIPLGVIASVLLADADLQSSALAGSFIGVAVGGLSFFLIRAAYRRLRSFEGLGMGDVKLAAAAGAWVGLDGLPFVLLMATGAAVATVAVSHLVGGKQSLSRTTPIPFGSFLAPSLCVIWFYRATMPPF